MTAPKPDMDNDSDWETASEGSCNSILSEEVEVPKGTFRSPIIRWALRGSTKILERVIDCINHRPLSRNIMRYITFRYVPLLFSMLKIASNFKQKEMDACRIITNNWFMRQCGQF